MNTSAQSETITQSRFPYISEGEFYLAMYKEVSNSRYLYNCNEEDKHDIIMGILERAWNRRRSFNPEKGKLTTWMNRVISSYICDRLKSDSRFEIISDEGWEKYDTAGTDSSQRKEKQLKALEKELSSLSDDDQKLMKLYEGGHSGKEIAELLNISETNVRARISRIKSKLREKKEIITCCDCKCPRYGEFQTRRIVMIRPH